MPDPLPRREGPDAMFAHDRPPTRGQWASIAALALEALDVKVPESRFEASVAIARLHAALERERAAA